MNDEYLLVDGYNIIYSWDELKAAADTSLEDARVRLQNILCDYAGYRQINVVVVFDAHKVSKGIGSIESYNNIKVVYTKEAQTADNFIESVSARLAGKYKVTVATSDNLEQIIIIGRGAYRISARELLLEIERAKSVLRNKYVNKRPVKRNMLLDNLDEHTAELLEKMRRGH